MFLQKIRNKLFRHDLIKNTSTSFNHINKKNIISMLNDFPSSDSEPKRSKINYDKISTEIFNGQFSKQIKNR